MIQKRISTSWKYLYAIVAAGLHSANGLKSKVVLHLIRICLITNLIYGLEVILDKLIEPNIVSNSYSVLRSHDRWNLFKSAWNTNWRLNLRSQFKTNVLGHYLWSTWILINCVTERCTGPGSTLDATDWNLKDAAIRCSLLTVTYSLQSNKDQLNHL